jgi:hypothetical protein
MSRYGVKDALTRNPASNFCLLISAATLLYLVFMATAGLIDFLRIGQFDMHYPFLIYGKLPVPGTNGALGADFAQVYSSARAARAGDSMYEPRDQEYRDPFGRRPNYPPFTNWLYEGISWMHYTRALLLHIFIQAILFLFLAAGFLYRHGLVKRIPLVFLAICCLIFLTPGGLQHLERGQFDLYSASCYLLFCAGYFEGRGFFFFFAGLLAGIKWTTLPFLCSFSVFAFFALKPEGRLKLLLWPVGFGVTVLPFLRQVFEWLPSLQMYEVNAAPSGITFQHFLSRDVTKLVPFMTAAMVTASCRLHRREKDVWALASPPLALALLIESFGFGTVGFEYRAVAFTGLIPQLAVWMEQSRLPTLTATAGYAYAVFLLIAFRGYGSSRLLTAVTMSKIYFASALVLTALALVPAVFESALTRARRHVEARPRSASKPTTIP